MSSDNDMRHLDDNLEKDEVWWFSWIWSLRFLHPRRATRWAPSWRFSRSPTARSPSRWRASSAPSARWSRATASTCCSPRPRPTASWTRSWGPWCASTSRARRVRASRSKTHYCAPPSSTWPSSCWRTQPTPSGQKSSWTCKSWKFLVASERKYSEARLKSAKVHKFAIKCPNKHKLRNPANKRPLWQLNQLYKLQNLQQVPLKSVNAHSFQERSARHTHRHVDQWHDGGGQLRAKASAPISHCRECNGRPTLAAAQLGRPEDAGLCLES